MKFGTLSVVSACMATTVAGVAIHASAPAAVATSAEPDETRCTALKGMHIGGATLYSASYIAAGEKLPPFNIPSPRAICQVRTSTSPVPSSTIKTEIWLPSQWNGKMLGLGGSGTSGGMATAGLSFMKPVGSGYVTIATDAGHENTDPPVWAFKQPERLIDYGYRANHLGAQMAKALIARYYGAAPKRSYFMGCSNGGRDALMLAQRFPNDYDGIVSGAPANNFVSLITNFTNYRKLIEKLPPDSLTPKLGMLHEAVLNRCDGLDGLKDGMIENQRACRFDPAELSCKPGQDAKGCLSPVEVNTIRVLYSGSKTRNGQRVHAGLPFGSEYLWQEWWTKPNSTGGNFATGFFGYFVHDNKNWAMADFDLDGDWAVAKRKLNGVLDATNTDIRPFVRKGGKLIMYQGWDDQAVSPENTISYFIAARKRLGSQQGNARLFMVPGMGHCFDGKGFTSADFVGEIDKWVEGGKAPEQIVAEKPVNYLFTLAGVPAKPLMTRPLCAWPKVARFDGKGPVGDDKSFTCTDPAQRTSR